MQTNMKQVQKMKTYLHQDKTVSKASAFSKVLNETEFTSVLDPDGIRDYHARIDMYFGGESIGSINVYYSPNKDTYKMTAQSVSDPRHREKILDYWQMFIEDGSLNCKKDHICAYVDGSFLGGNTGYGAVIIKNNTILHEISGKMDKEYNRHHQIGGELKAVLETLKWCKKNQLNDIHIYYDYNGIAMWATGKWRAKNTLTLLYQEYMLKQDLRIYFHKVPAHSGNRWNEYADSLAKKGSMQT